MATPRQWLLVTLDIHQTALTLLQSGFAECPAFDNANVPGSGAAALGGEKYCAVPDGIPAAPSPAMKLRYHKFGEGEPVVLLHGLLGSGENWHSVSLRLAKQFQVFALDQRNHGESPHASEMTYPCLAADVAEFIDANLYGAAHVLGHSMGGKTAMQLAVSHPEKVRSLIAVDIASRAYAPRHQEVFASLVGLDLAAYQSRKQVDDAMAPSIPDLATRRFLLKNIVHLPGGGFRWRIGLREIHSAYDNLCAAITGESSYPGRTLFVRGAESDYLTEADLPCIRGLFPRAHLKTVPRAGHWVHFENPDGFMEVTLAFLSHQFGTRNA